MGESPPIVVLPLPCLVCRLLPFFESGRDAGPPPSIVALGVPISLWSSQHQSQLTGCVEPPRPRHHGRPAATPQILGDGLGPSKVSLGERMFRLTVLSQHFRAIRMEKRIAYRSVMKPLKWEMTCRRASNHGEIHKQLQMPPHKRPPHQSISLSSLHRMILGTHT